MADSSKAIEAVQTQADLSPSPPPPSSSTAAAAAAAAAPGLKIDVKGPKAAGRAAAGQAAVGGLTIELGKRRDEISKSGTLLDEEGKALGNAAGVVVPISAQYRVVMTSQASVAAGGPQMQTLLDADEVCMDGVAQYELEFGERLGGGSFGVVWNCSNSVDGSQLAVKEVAVETGASLAASRRRHVKELRSLYKARACPDVVRFRGAFFADHHLFICMEYMDGGDLASLAARVGDTPLPGAVLVAAAGCVTRAMIFLKAASLMHRDIKPDNILVNSAGKLKLADFGESGELRRSRALTVAGNTLYAAPETLSGAGDPYTVKADVWSLGMTLVELALGYHPLVQSCRGGERAQLSMFALNTAIIHSPPPALDPAVLPHDYPAALADFVALALVQDPTARAGLDDLASAPLLTDAGAAPSVLAPAVAVWLAGL
ncbi:STE/STE7/MEK1 protein kinase [Thecamonas trahens ATCC 50062]|uniref:mitogen-activated protein kinase kinase n=1 Tax=Thecamonas trahens ATCC 50062 TaxID=461836 RepID=A0A0L0D987_THETB|nr:STE/STE7/MEK1 protein kinase [Thecamonas trahens ATCC 50062]KNC48947.1 STE/STE7/MEK1 protein kinase [Thecamonas trahens ATCC 50062]|eukprot:XP_013758364.1 STE/STE7/MEK1 protein kinase [Thecamonas trahens ATCC 50062]